MSATIPTNSLAGPWLDYAVFLAETKNQIAVAKPLFVNAPEADAARDWYSPSMKPQHCQQIIERVRPSLGHNGKEAFAVISGHTCLGPTYLIAFCRAYAHYELGPYLQLPEEAQG